MQQYLGFMCTSRNDGDFKVLPSDDKRFCSQKLAL